MKKFSVSLGWLFIFLLAVNIPGYSYTQEERREFIFMQQRTVPRLEYINTDEIMDILKVKPGMTILDIGTGTGYYTYKFAERMQGAGKVFATDINSEAINVMKEKVSDRALANLFPVLVKSEGVDEFYGQHKYDLIFLSYVYYNLANPVQYLKEMRGFLNKNGRVAILLYKNSPIFYADDFSNLTGLVKELSREPQDSPFYQGLSKSTRKLLKERPEGKIGKPIEEAVIEDFNRMLISPDFNDNFCYELLFKKQVAFSPTERDFANWLLTYLREEGALGKAPVELTPKERRAVIKLNKLFFIQRFRRYFNQNAEPAPFLSISDKHRQTSEFLVEKELKEAGYNLENKYDLLPYHVILIFQSPRDKGRD